MTGVFWVAANSYLFDRASDVPKATSDYTIAMSLAFLECGAPISFARLSAEPWALRCIACQSRHEQGDTRPPR